MIAMANMTRDGSTWPMAEPQKAFASVSLTRPIQRPKKNISSVSMAIATTRNVQNVRPTALDTVMKHLTRKTISQATFNHRVPWTAKRAAIVKASWPGQLSFGNQKQFWRIPCDCDRGRTMQIVGGDGRRFIVHVDERRTAFVKLDDSRVRSEATFDCFTERGSPS
jgi:hypothetical protein